MLQALGGPVPPNTDHAVSVSLPTWRSNIGYEEGEEWVMGKMQCGYPRFFVHRIIQKLVQEVVQRVGNPGKDTATLFASLKTARICHSFILSKTPQERSQEIRIISFVPSPRTEAGSVSSPLVGVIYPQEFASIGKEVWQHSGNGISSRRGEFCLRALQDGFLVEEKSSATDLAPQRPCKGPRRYQGRGSLSGPSKGSTPASSSLASTATSGVEDGRDYAQFIEERFGRNLSAQHADQAKVAIRRRIAGVLTTNVELPEALETASPGGRVDDISEDDVLLYPSGMSAIFNAHQTLMTARGALKSVCFGFPYTDTFKILQKWGTGCLFYGHGSSEDLDDLEKRLQNGERFLGLFTEAPGNPLLKTPDLARIRGLADKYDFAVVVDETISNFLNINVLQYADIVASSLTKVFSGDSNVMGGSVILNPHGQYYQKLKETYTQEYEDIYWAEDAVFLERNSRDFMSRIGKINSTSEEIAGMLNDSLLIKQVHYPKFSPTRPLYDSLRNPDGGYGGLFSVTFYSDAEAIAFYDTLEVLKGPSLGTNFTLCSPYVLLAHYGELDWARSFNADPSLVRISVGLEEVADLRSRFQKALDAVEKARA
ncbi:hypothetical protein N7478_001506 [Penicillium angulare]|uniref:uncharacterized protein n=1 Tax=Penicillium angulare TaxID=116970 RepID=UPI0025415A33|nr:uncharacterized protein N7478_001506 [Penicillium angulare]KAJ5288476.1 hypothetical protein N7478_001506 [Penicillium angulare]